MSVIPLNQNTRDLKKYLAQLQADVESGKVTGIAVICEHDDETYSDAIAGEFNYSAIIGRLFSLATFLANQENEEEL